MSLQRHKPVHLCRSERFLKITMKNWLQHKADWFWRSLETHISNHSARSSDNRNTNKHTLILAGTVKVLIIQQLCLRLTKAAFLAAHTMRLPSAVQLLHLTATSSSSSTSLNAPFTSIDFQLFPDGTSNSYIKKQHWDPTLIQHLIMSRSSHWSQRPDCFCSYFFLLRL